MKAFFNPKTVAIIGASKNIKKLGHVIMKNFMDFNFEGEIYPVNPKEKEILGKKCYNSVLNIKEKIDLAVVLVPPECSNNVVEQCVKKNIPAVVLITAGYKETGAIGITKELELKRIIKNTKTRVIGPNCIGLFDPYARTDTLFLPDYKLKRPSQGEIAFISQSGAFGAAILDWAATQGIGISHFVSYGNRVDVDDIDLIEYFMKDKKTKAILIYLEGPRQGRALYDCIKKHSSKKPIIILKAGKYKSGSNAAASHTGSLAGSYTVFKSAITQAGAIEAETSEDMFDYARALAHQPKPKGKNVAVITNGGGFGVLSADALEKYGFNLPQFEKQTISKISEIMPGYSTIHNPLDIVGDADVNRYEVTIKAALKDKNIDAIIVCILLQTAPLDPDIVDLISSVNESKKKPMLIVSAGGEYTQILLKSLENEGIPAYPSPERAVRSLKALLKKSNN
ncbi:CoA-binding protein [archaeon]|nr:CoA-binding protein [archaeon]